MSRIGNKRTTSSWSRRRKVQGILLLTFEETLEYSCHLIVACKLKGDVCLLQMKIILQSFSPL